MLYERTPLFVSDFKRLPPEHQRLVLEAVHRFRSAAEQAVRGQNHPWHPGLRVRRVVGTTDIWEMTWSFRTPDGRATWQWAEIVNPRTGEAERGIRWRRVGSHPIFRNP
ncbi:MAG: hypothetical protein U9N78_10885 [Actinomycetota bacterium]|nr:hypothetical protein [Actinomycetota bacterium]